MIKTSMLERFTIVKCPIEKRKLLLFSFQVVIFMNEFVPQMIFVATFLVLPRRIFIIHFNFFQ